MQPKASLRLARKQQSTVRRRVGARQRRELAVEILEAQVDLQPLRVLDEERAGVARCPRARRLRAIAAVMMRELRSTGAGRLSQSPIFASLPGYAGSEIAELRDERSPAGRG